MFQLLKKASEMQCPEGLSYVTLKVSKPQVALRVCKEDGTKYGRWREWQGKNMNRKKKCEEKRQIKTSNVISLTLSYPCLNLTHQVFIPISFYRHTHKKASGPSCCNYIPWQATHHKSVWFLTNFSPETLFLPWPWWCVIVTLATGQLLIWNTNRVWDNFTAQQGYCDWSEQPLFQQQMQNPHVWSPC